MLLLRTSRGNYGNYRSSGSPSCLRPLVAFIQGRGSINKACAESENKLFLIVCREHGAGVWGAESERGDGEGCFRSSDGDTDPEGSRAEVRVNVDGLWLRPAVETRRTFYRSRRRN